jgi:uncharacterized protein YjeT (DUF2065 family)
VGFDDAVFRVKGIFRPAAMRRTGLLYWLLVAIAAVTVISGLVQAVTPGLILRLLSSESTKTSRHFFGIVGMFMVLFGGMLLHALRSRSNDLIAVLWAGLQKLGASAAVGLGVFHSIFSPLALLVAGFDFVSGVLMFVYWSLARKS